MSYDFKMHIDENSVEGKVIASVMASEHIGPEEAAQRLLELGARVAPSMDPVKQQKASELIGDRPTEADVAVFDEVVAAAMEARQGRWEQRLGA